MSLIPVYRGLTAVPGARGAALSRTPASPGERGRAALPRARGTRKPRPAVGAAALDPRGEHRRGGLDLGADRPPRGRASRAQHAGHHGHGHLGAVAGDAAPDRPRLAPICAGRSAPLCPPLPRALEARPGTLDRIGAVAEPDRRDAPARHSAAAGERPHVARLLPALEPGSRADPAAAAGLRSLPDAGCDPGGALSSPAGRAQSADRGRPQIRRGAVAGRRGRLRGAAVCDRPAPPLARRQHP